MRSTPFTRRATGRTLMVVLLTGALVPLGARAGAVASPVSAESDAGSLTAMLGRLPDRPLGLDGAMVTYADVARQTAALGADAPRAAGDEEGRHRWTAAVRPLSLPQTTGQHWSLPEWRAAFGFDLFQVAQAVEYAAPPFGLTVLRGTFDPAELRRAWTRGGYQPVDLGTGEAYAVREDFAISLSDPGGRMALGYLNVVALADDSMLILGSTREGVRGVLAAAAGTAPSFTERADIAPLLRAAPPDLFSALFVDGELLRAVPDPAAAFLGDESPRDFATRVAGEQVEARRLPPVTAALLGQTAGLLPGDLGTATPEAMPTQTALLVVVLSTTSPDAAETAATVIAERLATGRTSPLMSSETADRPWAELFPERSVRAMPGEPAVLIELIPAPGVQPFILQGCCFNACLVSWPGSGEPGASQRYGVPVVPCCRSIE
jgi:hypothetical protein